MSTGVSVRRPIGLALLAGVVGVLLLPGTAAARRTIDVFPGRSAIQKAVARANAGDTVLVHRGKVRGPR